MDNQQLNAKIIELALEYHKGVKGEYGCPGIDCPEVKKLIAFGAKCAMAAVDEAIRLVGEVK